MTLHVENLSFERNHQIVLSDINFQLQCGEWLQITGRNGSGKSTLLRLIAGFLEPSQGKIHWNMPRDLHYVGHQSGIKLYLTVLENLKLFYALANRSFSFSHATQCTHDMDLHSVLHTHANSLSAGQLRRLALTRLKLFDARVWILDEPTTALDQAGQEKLKELLEDHLQQQGIAIIATHQAFSLTQDPISLVLGESHV